MVLSRGKVRKKPIIQLRDIPLEVIDDYVYQGMIFNYNGNFNKAIQMLCLLTKPCSLYSPEVGSFVLILKHGSRRVHIGAAMVYAYQHPLITNHQEYKTSIPITKNLDDWSPCNHQEFNPITNNCISCAFTSPIVRDRDWHHVLCRCVPNQFGKRRVSRRKRPFHFHHANLGYDHA